MLANNIAKTVFEQPLLRRSAADMTTHREGRQFSDFSRGYCFRCLYVNFKQNNKVPDVFVKCCLRGAILQRILQVHKRPAGSNFTKIAKVSSLAYGPTNIGLYLATL